MRTRNLAVATAATCLVTACSTGGGSAPTTTSSSTTSTATASSPSSPRPDAALPTAPGVDARSWREVDSRTRALGRDTAVFTGVIDSTGQLKVVHRAGPTDLRPLASVVKVYVLLAVLDRIEAGSLRWDSVLTTRSSDLAGGSGSLAGRGVGARISLRAAARLMFQVSDNTATSLLVRTVGQDALRTAVRESGHSQPAALDPFLTIRQDLWLQWSTDPSARTARARWASASSSQRTSLIAPADRSAMPDLTRSGALWRQKLGYLGSAEDIARAWTAIAVRAKKTGSLNDVLTVPSPGFTAPPAWRTVWFKSGSLSGVQNGSWLGQGPHGGQVVVVLSASDGNPSEGSVRGLASSAAAVLDAYAAKH